MTYFFWYCRPDIGTLWFGVYVLLMPIMWSQPYFPAIFKSKLIRAVIHILVAFLASFVYLHYYLVNGRIDPLHSMTLRCIINVGFSGVCGAFIWASKIPERFWPGKFDFIGHSHNIWHIMGTIVMYLCRNFVYELYEYRRHDPECLYNP